MNSFSYRLSIGDIVEISTIFDLDERGCRRHLLLSVLSVTFRTSVRIVHTAGKKAVPMSVPEIAPSHKVLSHDVLADGMDAMATPIEFTFKGKRFRIHAVLSRWCEAGGWWNRVSDGRYRPDDKARALWTVEAAPIGALATFEIERDEATGQWLIRSI
jgi:hypothetical protein